MADLFVVLVLLLLLLLPVVAAWLFRKYIAHRIPSDIFRILSIIDFYLLSLVGLGWGSLKLFGDFGLGDLYPITTHPLNDPYYFTQQEYGFATLVSSGYDLTFYQQRPYWFDRELGKVQLECSGKELVRATIISAGTECIRLQLAADGQQRLDTTLSTTQPFNFRRTFEDLTIDFSRKPF